MDIWIFNHYAAPPTAAAGTRHFAFGRHLTRRGHRVTVFAASFNHWTRRDEHLRWWQLTKRETHDGVRFVWLRTVPYQSSSILRALNMFSYFVVVLVVQVVQRRPDWIIGSSVHPLAPLAAMLVARWRASRFCFEVRDLWPQTLVDMGALPSRSPIVALLRLIEQALYRRADLVITLLEMSREYIVARGATPNRLIWIPNGADLAAFAAHADDSVAGRSYGRHVNWHVWRRQYPFVVVYAGALGRANGVQVLVRAAAELARRGRHDIGLLVVGDGPDGLAARRLSEAHRLHNVYFLGAVPKVSVSGILRHTDAGILHVGRSPVYRFGSSFNKLFDYMAAGLPVLMAVDPPSESVLASGGAIAVAPDNPPAIADAIQALADLPGDERRRMGEAGRSYIQTHHDIAVLAQRLEEALKSGLMIRRDGRSS